MKPLNPIYDNTHTVKRIDLSYETVTRLRNEGWGVDLIKQLVQDTVYVLFNHPRAWVYIKRLGVER